MARERTTEDRILSLMARVPYPMSCAELAKSVEVSKQYVLNVLSMLEEKGVVSRHVAARSEAAMGGRPPATFSLLGSRLAPPALRPLLRAFPPDTIVLTPMGRRARVNLVDAEGTAEIHYLDGDMSAAEIRVQLLRAFQPGRAQPDPVRVDG